MIDTPILCCDRTHELSTTGSECPCVSCRSHRCIQALHADAATLRAENDRLRRGIVEVVACLDEVSEDDGGQYSGDEMNMADHYAGELRAVLEGETG